MINLAFNAVFASFWLLLILYIDKSVKLSDAREEFDEQLNDAIKHLTQQEQLVILLNMYGKDWQEHKKGI